jgi:hypothetical protein
MLTVTNGRTKIPLTGHQFSTFSGLVERLKYRMSALSTFDDTFGNGDSPPRALLAVAVALDMPIFVICSPARVALWRAAAGAAHVSVYACVHYDELADIINSSQYIERIKSCPGNETENGLRVGDGLRMQIGRGLLALFELPGPFECQIIDFLEVCRTIAFAIEGDVSGPAKRGDASGPAKRADEAGWDDSTAYSGYVLMFRDRGEKRASAGLYGAFPSECIASLYILGAINDPYMISETCDGNIGASAVSSIETLTNFCNALDEEATSTIAQRYIGVNMNVTTVRAFCLDMYQGVICAQLLA